MNGVVCFTAALALPLCVAAQETGAARGPAARLAAAALEDGTGYARLAELCDRIGNRLSGSAALERAVEWSAAQMKSAGLENVTTLQVKVPHWVRGRESAAIVEPVRRRLTILGLGGSVGTPKEGLTAAVAVVSGFEELEKRGRAGVQGKIVLFDAPFEGYGRTVVYRDAGPSRAARLGAAAALVRSVTPVSLQSPHTGALSYDSNAPRIPAAAVTIEDAELLRRLTAAGAPVRVHLEMEARELPEAGSADVFGDIPGRELPDEIVVIGGHLDSWDVGQGAQDDGSGVMVALESARLIRMLDLRPRRTLRVVFWTNEENGGAGAKAYRDWVGSRIHDHVAAIEMDGGAEKPVGFGFSGSPAALDTLRAFAPALESIGAGTIARGGGGADIEPLMRDGVPGLGLRTTGAHYFDWHHSAADTLDKVDPRDFRLNVAAMAVMAYELADMPRRLE